MNSSLNKDRHQAIHFGKNLPLTCSSEEFDQLLKRAREIGLLRKISPGKFNWLIKNFGDKARVINSINSSISYEYAGPIYLGPDSYKTYQTLEWQIFEALKSIHLSIIKKQAKEKKYEQRIGQLQSFYERLLGAIDEANDQTENNLKEFLDTAQKLKIIIEKPGITESETKYIRYKRPEMIDGKRMLKESYYIFCGHSDLEWQIFNALRLFKKKVMEKIYQERTQQCEKKNTFSHHISDGGSRKVAKLWLFEMNTDKDKRQRKWEKKQRKWRKKQEKYDNWKKEYEAFLDGEE